MKLIKKTLPIAVVGAIAWVVLKKQIDKPLFHFELDEKRKLKQPTENSKFKIHVSDELLQRIDAKKLGEVFYSSCVSSSDRTCARRSAVK